MSALTTTASRLVRANLRIARLPLRTVQTLTGAGDDWAPAMFADGVEGVVKEAAGGFLGDDSLVAEGRLLRARATELQRAERLESKAEAERQRAAAEHEAAQQRVEKRREETEARADARERSIEQDRRRAERKAAEELRAEETAARQAEAAREKTVRRQQRAAKAAKLDLEAEALSDQAQAVAAESEVIELDEAIERSKQARSRS